MPVMCIECKLQHAVCCLQAECHMMTTISATNACVEILRYVMHGNLVVLCIALLTGTALVHRVTQSLQASKQYMQLADSFVQRLLLQSQPADCFNSHAAD